MNPTRQADEVVLVDDHGHPVGSAPRATVHGPQTPLHLAFSCYLVDGEGRLLVTRRALAKRTWPGVWTNSFCGHPRPGETVEDALRRHADHELGVAVDEVRCLLPDFRYRALDASGVVEHEVCPVYVARLADPGRLRPHPEEVAEHQWVDPEDLRRAVTAAPWSVSPWLVEQLAALESAGVWAEVSAAAGVAR